MSTGVSKLGNNVAEMRRLFDETFAVASPERVTEPEPMLAIRIASEPFALRVREISGLVASRERIVPVPSRAPELLGLTGVRGIVVPVFSMARLLGFDSEHERARWLVLCGERQSPIALAFESLERMFEVPGSEIFAREEAASRRYVTATVCEGATPRGIISISALVEFIKTRGTSERRK